MIITGDCLEVMKTLDASSIDAIVTDPPYGLSFMGKDWDKGVPGEAFWREALRVAKPGCHLLAAGGTRTFHRLTVAIEDAGWEIRDCVMWVYGSGFPKSHNIGKAIDKAVGAEREVVGKREHPTLKDKSRVDRQGRLPNHGSNDFADEWDITAPATPEAAQWDGWGTALKPAWEPFILARKPLNGTVANNVLRHGCGGLNVDGCKVGTETRVTFQTGTTGAGRMRACNLVDRGDGKTPDGRCLETALKYVAKSKNGQPKVVSGRWPANVIHDGSDTVDFMGKSARFFYTAKASRSEREAGLDGMEERNRLEDVGDKWTTVDRREGRKCNTKARNHHPTVKPTALMQYLCKLITPPDGTILDPFCGSGSTGVAAIREGFNFIGIELNPEYAEIAKRRIKHERNRMPLLEAIR